MKSDESNDARLTEGERRARMLADLAADMEARIVPSPDIDPGIMARYERDAELFDRRDATRKLWNERRKDGPR